MSSDRKWYVPGPALIFLLISIGLFIGCCLYVKGLTQAQSLDDIDGYSELKGLGEDGVESQPSRPRNLLKVLRQADFLGERVEISERELNHYLHTTVFAKQNGTFNLISTISGVWVRLHDGFAEVIIERRVQGYQSIHAHQVSYFIKARVDGGASLAFENGESWFKFFPVAGRIGRKAVPAAIAKLNFPAIESLAATYEKELEFLYKKSARFEILDDKIIYVGRGTGKPQS